MDSELTGAAVRHAMDAVDAAKKAQRRAEMITLAAATISGSTANPEFSHWPLERVVYEAVNTAEATLAEIDRRERSK